MKQFIVGMLVGSALTASIGLAGNFYDSSGKPSAPYGSVQSYDYFRARQQFLDLNAMRRNSDAARAEDPCGKGR
jgi:hypothetical protein